MQTAGSSLPFPSLPLPEQRQRNTALKLAASPSQWAEWEPETSWSHPMAHLPLRTLDKELLHPSTPTLQGLLETRAFLED